MPILFPDFLQEKLNRPNQNGETYWDELKKLVDLYDMSSSDWFNSNSIKYITQTRQLDKFEPVITYYLFAALAEATLDFTRADLMSALLKKAYSSQIAEDLAGKIAHHGSASLAYEAQIVPNNELRQSVAEQVNSHPIAYHRYVASNRSRVRFESATRLDCFLGEKAVLGSNAKRRPGQFGFGIEAKFTSDIADETTYVTHRNQIARIVEVGNQRAEQFAFLLLAPRSYRLSNSRLFVYKMNEYMGEDGIAQLRRDLLMPPSDEIIASWIQHIGWLDWEDITELLYPRGQPRIGWQSAHHDALREFLIDRRLWP